MVARLLAVSVLVGPGAALAEDAAMQSAFGPGEQITYKVAYLGVTAGTAQVTVGAEMKQWGKAVWPIVTVAKTESIAAVYPIKDKFVTYWDPSAQKTIGSDLWADENRRKRRQRIKLSGDGKAEVIKQRQGEDEVVEHVDVDPNTLDVAAAAMLLRNRPLDVGQEHHLPVFTGKRQFTLVAKVEARETIATPLGEKSVFKVRALTEFSGKLQQSGDLFVYFTADDARVPVKMEAQFLVGSMTAEAVQYQPGKRYAMK